MLRCLAAAIFIFITVFVLIYRGAGDAENLEISEQTEDRLNPEMARSKSVRRGARVQRVPVVTPQQREAALSALLAAAEIEVSKKESVQWSERHFRNHLAKLSSEDVRVLLMRFFESKVPPVEVNDNDDEAAFRNWLQSRSETNHSKLISGLVGKLAKEDFTDTVSWLNSLPIFQTNTQLSRFVYNEVISAGAAQAPREAWSVYQQRCQPWGGFSVHSTSSVGVLSPKDSTDHLVEILMDTDYDTARLILDKEPIATQGRRIHQFLSNPVKGRSLEQLHNDYVELSAGKDQDGKESLETSYLAGWAHLDAEGALDWVSSNVNDEARRKQLYDRVLKSNINGVMDLMLTKHGENDDEIMMNSITMIHSGLTEKQKALFDRKNQYEPANEIGVVQNIVITESRIEMPVFSSRKSVAKTEEGNPIVIPRP